MSAASTATPANTATTATAPTPSPDQALDQLRAAQLRRQLASDRSSIFVHAARPAIIPSSLEHHWQRSFGPGPAKYVQELEFTEREAKSLGAKAEVFRDGKTDFGDLTLSLGLHTSAEIKVRMPPYELRDLAARLIDAAHDIETHPAAALACEQEGGAA